MEAHAFSPLVPFSARCVRPAAVAEYMRGVLTRKGKMYLGHNPGSAYGIFAMLALVLGLAVTGIMLGQGNESVEDLHEILA